MIPSARRGGTTKPSSPNELSNLLVKHKMMKKLGWTYDENEPHTINGVTLPSGIIVPAKTVEWTNDNEKVFTLAAERRERREREGDI